MDKFIFIISITLNHRYCPTAVQRHRFAAHHRWRYNAMIPRIRPPTMPIPASSPPAGNNANGSCKIP
ncbi:hypothetical protein X945_5975 [Burkholderia pseudomallei ABCPW 107]|nr:hypothetical protein X948_5714 [Burkholderia pseudomallei MSHR5608]KGS16628.1 hypothetical protein X989_5879 [Burkholderia pseudomallei MSHR4378]KGS34721.1 hypothetical protein X945_5975 [Burkholderia pseudomallei ABCPW 107]KGW37932.1 hypothetical protein Y047_6182 [Burkholderia pseudomallei MSHR3016]KGX94507.1 hypothetical protein X997_5829 [Burkholderia pseudomallei A79C]